MPTTLVLGLGNPILGDDGAGWLVAQEVERRRAMPCVEVDCAALGGLSLMERMVGYQHVVIADSIVTGRHAIGSVLTLRLSDLASGVVSHSGSAHDVSLATAIQIGRTMGAELPDDLLIIGIETAPTFEFSTRLTDPVAAAIPVAVRKVLEAVAAWTEAG